MTGSGGVSSTPGLLDSIIGVSGILDHPHARVMTMESVARSYAMNSQRFSFQAAKHVIASQRLAMTFRHTSAFPRRDAPEVLHENCPSRNEGAGNTGCTLHPRSRVQKCTTKTHTSIQVQRRQSGIPCAMVLRLVSCSPRRSGFFGTVALRILARPPGRARAPPQDLRSE